MSQSADTTEIKKSQESLPTPTDIARTFEQLLNEMRKVVIGNLDIIQHLWIAMLIGKHVYLEGVPGIAKTWTTNRFTDTMGCQFSRIQFTPDMLPSDIVGTNIFNPKTGTFRLKKGPIFSNVILADEINRAPPKTQSAMLEAMAEGQVSIEGETHKLIRPFVVIATANPVEQEGTYPLPEAQLDRFLVKLNMEYLSSDEELRIIKLKHEAVYETAETITSPETILKFMKVIEKQYVAPDVLAYMRDIVISTRHDPRLTLGCSPRASISILEASKARAAIQGRSYVIPDDIIFMTPHVIHHRMILKPEAELEGITAWKIANDILDAVEVPVAISEIVDQYSEDTGVDF